MERAEKIGLSVAAGGHVLLFGLLSIGMLAPTPDAFKPKPVEVSLIGEVSPEAAAPKVSQEAPAPAAAPEVGAPSEDTPPPAPMERVVEPRPEPAPQRPVERTPPPRPVERPAPAKKVVTKPATKPAPAKQVTKPASKPLPAKTQPPATKPGAGATPPRQSRLGKDFLKGVPSESGGTAREATAKKASATVKRSIDVSISAEIKPFWQRNAPTGVDVDQLVTVVELRLAQDGSLASTPRCKPTTGVTDSNRNQAGLHCERAIKAARLAAPFKLPAEYYDDWKTWQVTFRTQ